MAPKKSSSPSKKHMPLSPGPDDGAIDKRKMRDEFKKPIEETATLVHDFVMKREVPTAVLVAQAEAMQARVNGLAAQSGLLAARIEKLKAEIPPASTFLIMQLTDEKRRLDEQLGKLHDKYLGRRDIVLSRTALDLISTMDAYNKQHEESLKTASEAEALADIADMRLPTKRTITALLARTPGRPTRHHLRRKTEKRE